MEKKNALIFQNDVLGQIKGIIDENGKTWYLAGKVCKNLGLKDYKPLIRRIANNIKVYEKYLTDLHIDYVPSDKPKEIKVDKDGKKSTSYLLPENYVYELMLLSNKQKAVGFRNWITSQILPELRKNHCYATQNKMIDITKIGRKKKVIVKVHGIDFTKKTNSKE